MPGADATFTVHIRSLMWLSVGVVITLCLTVAVVGMRADAAPGDSETTYVPISPCRLADTRSGDANVGDRNTPLAADETHAQQVTGAVGDCNVPAEATGVSLNVTAVGATAPSFMTIFPFGAALPTVSNLNYSAGSPPTPNKVDVKLSNDGKIGVYNLAGIVQVIIDVGGYYTTQGIQDLIAADATFIKHGEIVISEGTSTMLANGASPPSDLKHFGGGVKVSGDGVVELGLSGVAKIGGVEYGLQSLRYCIDDLIGGAFIERVIVNKENGSDFVSDITDRSVTGCYTVNVGYSSGQAFDVQLDVDGGGDLRIRGIQTTWRPADQIVAPAP